MTPGFKKGQIYVPLQFGGQPTRKDMDEIINTRYGKVHVVVRNFILIKHELVTEAVTDEQA